MNRAAQNANAAIISRVTGVPRSPATPETDSDPLNPNAKTPCDVEHSAAGSTAGSSRAPHRGAPVLRLV